MGIFSYAAFLGAGGVMILKAVKIARMPEKEREPLKKKAGMFLILGIVAIIMAFVTFK